MKFIRKLRWVIITIIVLFIAGWLFIRYTNRDFLRYGVLHIDKLPNSVKIISNEAYGISDEEIQYYISLNPNEFNKLLVGRKYIQQNNAQINWLSQYVGSEKISFPLMESYTSGVLKDGLVNIFVNKDKSMAYVVYDIN